MQSGESNLVLRSCKGKSTAKKRQRADTDSQDAGLVREDGEDSQKQHLHEISKHKAQINSQMSEVEEVSSLKQQLMKATVDQLICENDNRPLKALWEALNDEDTPGTELPMAIVMDPRCGIERRAERDDNLVDSEEYNLDNVTPLMLAVQVHRNDVVEALLAAGADHSARDNSSYTSYLVAASYGNVTAMDILVRYGADPFAVSDTGSSALHVAAYMEQAIQVLVELGASTEALDVGGYTPLLRAASRGDVPSMEALLDNGANLEAVGRDGMTPLHQASKLGHIGAIETLVWEGASITAIDKSGVTPFDMVHKCFNRNRCSNAQKARVKGLLTPTSLH